MEGGLYFVEGDDAFELGGDTAVGADDEDPWLALEAPLEDGGNGVLDVGLAEIAEEVGLDVDEDGVIAV